MHAHPVPPSPAVRLPGDADRLPAHDLARVRAAARHARRVLPGPVGELVARELTANVEFGYRFRTDALIPRLVTQVLAMQVPEAPDGSSEAA